MTPDEQAIYLNGVPLVVLGAAYLAAGALRLRRRRDADLVLVLVLPAVGVAAAALGAVVLAAQEPVGGRPWIVLAATVVGLVPALALLVRPDERPRVEPRAEEHQRVRAAVNAFTAGLIRADAPGDVARMLARSVVDVVGVDFAAVAEIAGGSARGLFATRADGRELAWWRAVELDLDEPSAIASAAFEAAPFTVYDVESSPYVDQEIAREVGAKSGVWVPLVSGERVLAVVAAVTTGARRVFSGDDVALLQELAAESALALDRVRSGAALEEALGRERLVARIAQRVRSELDLDALLEVAAVETAAAARADRCLVLLGSRATGFGLGAEWAAEGLDPVGDRSDSLPAANLAARERRIVAVADVEEAEELDEPGFGGRRALVRLGTRAVLALPIVVFDEVIGALSLHRVRPGPWGDDERSLAEAVVHELGHALHTARLLAENERRVARQSALVEAAEALASELDFDAVIARLAEECARVLDADAADCWLYDERGEALRCRAVHGLPAEMVGRTIALAGTLGEAVVTGRPVLERDFARRELPPPSDDYAGFAEVMDAPIAVGGSVRGALGVCAREPGRFREDDLGVLEAFASLAGLALRNAEQLADSARQARIQRGFFRIAAVLAQPLSHADALDAVAAAAGEGLGGSYAAVLMPRGGTLELAGTQNLPEPLRRALADGLPEGETALTAAAVEGRVLASPDVAADDRLGPGWGAALAAAGARSLLAVPVRPAREGDVSGLVLVFFAEERRVDDDDLELAGHLAGAARGALERSALFEEERAARSLAQQLARTGALLATELDPAAVLEEVVRQAPALVGVEACAIRVLEGDALVLSAVSADDADADALLGERSAPSVRLSGDVIQSRAPLAVVDAAEDERLRAADPLLALGYRGFLAVPLAGPEGAVHGALAVYARRPKTWKRDEIEALLALAANASAALSNAELYQRVAIEKERSFAILANIADGIVAVDRDGKVVLWNASAGRITGVPATEALGRTPFQVLGRHLESDEPGPAGERPLAVLRGGEEVWLSLTEAVMRDPAGGVAGRIFAFRDVSADRLVEQMKSEFVSTVSQELRRPLTSIYGFAETLLRTDVLFGDEERRTFLGYIASESGRLTTIVDALLNVARLEGGDLQIDVVPTDVRGLVTDLVGSLPDTVPAVEEHAVVVDFPEQAIMAEADPDKLRQVLLVLIENACKFSPAGGTVTIGARRRADVVELSVADEGIGIPRAEQPRIFRKFYRGDGRDSAGGTGLGLFIARGLVAAMGGRIWVTSEEGSGSRFAFELPLADAGVRESEAERVRASGGR